MAPFLFSLCPGIKLRSWLGLQSHVGLSSSLKLTDYWQNSVPRVTGLWSLFSIWIFSGDLSQLLEAPTVSSLWHP